MKKKKGQREKKIRHTRREQKIIMKKKVNKLASFAEEHFLLV